MKKKKGKKFTQKISVSLEIVYKLRSIWMEANDSTSLPLCDDGDNGSKQFNMKINFVLWWRTKAHRFPINYRLIQCNVFQLDGRCFFSCFFFVIYKRQILCVRPQPVYYSSTRCDRSTPIHDTRFNPKTHDHERPNEWKSKRACVWERERAGEKKWEKTTRRTAKSE